MNIYDISMQISEEMVVYKNKSDKLPSLIATRTLAQGARESRISLNSHTGTHVDAPSHMLENGTHMDSVSLDSLVGECMVFDMTTVQQIITSEVLSKLDIKQDSKILFKTKNSLDLSQQYNPEFVYLSAEGANYLALKKVRTVGIDYLGIERNQEGHETHKILFANNITLIEGLRLKDVPAGDYFLCCLPLHLKGADAAPSRAILIK